MNKKQLKEYITLSSIPIRSLDKNKMPQGMASACLLKYNNKHLLLTVQHATGDQKNWGIQVKFVPKKGTEIQQLGGMYFLKSINIETNNSKDIDFSYKEVSKKIMPMHQVIDQNTGLIVEERKRLIGNLNFDIKLNKKELYGFSGQIMPQFNGSTLITEEVTYIDLQYIGEEADYYAFKLPFTHPGHEYFQGCSGAPIIDTKGNVVALVCYGDISKNLVYGISLKRYETAINATYGELPKDI